MMYQLDTTHNNNTHSALLWENTGTNNHRLTAQPWKVAPEQQKARTINRNFAGNT
jgi:hypothetical protein